MSRPTHVPHKVSGSAEAGACEYELAEISAIVPGSTGSGNSGSPAAISIRDFGSGHEVDNGVSNQSLKAAKPSIWSRIACQGRGASHPDAALAWASDSETRAQSVKSKLHDLQNRMVAMLREISGQTYGPKSAIPSSAGASLVRSLRATGERTKLHVEVLGDPHDDGRGTHLQDRFRPVLSVRDAVSPLGRDGLGFLWEHPAGVTAQHMTDVEHLEFETPIDVCGKTATLAVCQRRGEYALMTFFAPEEEATPWAKISAITVFAHITLGGACTATPNPIDRNSTKVDALNIELLHEITLDNLHPRVQTSVVTFSTANRFHRLDEGVCVAGSHVHDLIICSEGEPEVDRGADSDRAPDSAAVPVDITYFTENIPVFDDQAQRFAWLNEIGGLTNALRSAQSGLTKAQEADPRQDNTTWAFRRATKAGADKVAAGRPKRSTQASIAAASGSGAASEKEPTWPSSRWHWKLWALRAQGSAPNQQENASASSVAQDLIEPRCDRHTTAERPAAEDGVGCQDEQARPEWDSSHACLHGDPL